MADAIVIGTAMHFGEGRNEDAARVGFVVHRYLRGSGARGDLIVSLPPGSELEEGTGASASQHCAHSGDGNPRSDQNLEPIQVTGGGTLRIRCRDRYVLFLEKRADGTYKLQRAFAADDSKRGGALRKLLPHIPSWGKPSSKGLAAMIITDTPHVSPGDDIELSLGLKNLGSAPVQLNFGGAREERSHYTLRLVGPGDSIISASPHPALDKKGLDHFFTHLSRRETLTLEPGASFFLPKEPINSAQGGWGYKEQLDFSFYPMQERGRYRIFATARRFLNDAAPETLPLEVVVD